MALRTIRHACIGSVCIAFPLRHNRYRPYALRHPVLAAVGAFLITSKAAVLLLGILAPQTAYLADISPSALVQHANQSRAEAGLPALSVNPLLEEPARRKAEDMLKHNYFDHNSPQGVTPWQWFDDAGYTYIFAGENLAIDFRTSAGVHHAWMESPGHRRNILSDRYREIGIAAVTGNFDGRTTTVVVQHFGSRQAEPVPQSDPPEPQPAPTPEPAPTPQPVPAPEPLPAPVIIEPEEGILLPSGAATMRGEAAPGSNVHIMLDSDENHIGTWPAPDGTFHGTFLPPEDQEREAVLIATAERDGQTSPPSSPRQIFLATRGPIVAADEVFFLPDPTGDITSLLFVVPVSDTITEITANIGRERVPLSIDGTVASARVEKRILGREFEIHITDQHGNTGTVMLQPIRAFHEVQRNPSEQQTLQRIREFVLQLQTATFWIFAIVATLMTATIAIHLRKENADILAHAVFVVTLGVVLLMTT